MILRIKKNVSSSDEVTQMLENNFGGFPLTLLLHERISKMLNKKGVCYTGKMKDFVKRNFFIRPKLINIYTNYLRFLILQLLENG